MVILATLGQLRVRLIQSASDRSDGARRQSEATVSPGTGLPLEFPSIALLRLVPHQHAAVALAIERSAGPGSPPLRSGLRWPRGHHRSDRRLLLLVTATIVLTWAEPTT